MCMLLNGSIFFQDSDLGHGEREKRDLGGKEHSTCLHICSQRNNQVCTNLASGFCGLCSMVAHLTGQTHAWSFGSQPHLHGCLYETDTCEWNHKCMTGLSLKRPVMGNILNRLVGGPMNTILKWCLSTGNVFPWVPTRTQHWEDGIGFTTGTAHGQPAAFPGLPFTTLGFLWEGHFLQISIFSWAIGVSCTTYQSLSLYRQWWSLSVHCERKEVKPSCFWWQTKTWLAYLLYFSCLLFSSFMGKHPHLKNLQAIKHDVNSSGN